MKGKGGVAIHGGVFIVTVAALPFTQMMFYSRGRWVVWMVVICSVCLPASRAAEVWLKASTEDVVIISNASRRAITEYAMKYTAFRRAFIELLAPEGKRPPPVTLLLFQSAAELQKHLAKNPDRDVTITVFSTEVDNMALLAMSDSGNREDALSMAFEFDTIWSLRRVGYFLPLWASQGIGEVLASLRVKKGQCIVDGNLGRVDSTWTRLPAIPWDRFFDISQGSSEYKGKEATGMYQAQTWALMNLILLQEGKPRERFETLVKKIQSFQSGPQVIEEILGVPPAKFNQAINRHLRQTHSVSIPFDEKAILAGLKIEPADDAEVKVRMSDLLQANRLTYEAERVLDQAVAKLPGSTIINEALGRRALRANDLSGAARRYREAMATGSVNTNAWLTSALDYLDQSAGFGRDVAGGGRRGVDKAVTEIQRAIELNPGDMRAWQILGRAYFVAEKPSEAGVTELTRALTDDEDGLRVRYYRALLYQRLGKKAEAIADLDVIVENPKSPLPLRNSAAAFRRQLQPSGR